MNMYVVTIVREDAYGDTYCNLRPGVIGDI